MHWDQFLPDAVLHKQVYIALLRGLLLHGQKQDIAQRAGITPIYLSNILDIDHHPPGDDVADRLVRALPIDTAQRQTIRHHMALARGRHAATQQALTNYVTHESADQMVSNLLAHHHQATFAADTQSAYLAVIMEGEAVLRQLSPLRTPLAYAQTCLVLHDAYAVRNKHNKALFVILRAHDVLTRTSRSVHDQVILDRLFFNVLYALSLTYRNIGLPDEGRDVCLRAEHLLTGRHIASREWEPYIYRDHMETLGQTNKRFSIAEAEGLFTLSENALQRENTPGADLFHILSQKTLLSVYRNHGQKMMSARSMKKGRQVAHSLLHRVGHDDNLGPIHKSVILRSVAQFWLVDGEHQGAYQSIQRALSIATQAGLTHQIAQLQSMKAHLLG